MWHRSQRGGSRPLVSSCWIDATEWVQGSRSQERGREGRGEREREWRLRQREGVKKKKCPDAYESTNVCFGFWEWSSIVLLTKHQNTIQGWHPVGDGEEWVGVGGGVVGWQRTQAVSTALRLSCCLRKALNLCSTARDCVHLKNKILGSVWEEFFSPPRSLMSTFLRSLTLDAAADICLRCIVGTCACLHINL